MTLNVVELGDQLVIVEGNSGKIRIELFSENRWSAVVRLLVRESANHDWSIYAAGCIYGEPEPFLIARASLLDTIEQGSILPTDTEQFRQEMEQIVFAGGRLRGGSFDERMHYPQIVAFLNEVLREDPNIPEQVRARKALYELDAADYVIRVERLYSVRDIDFTGDWVYSMAVDLVRRQCEPSDALCVIVATEPLDVEFLQGFVAFRYQLDQISGDYVHFFALSDLNGGPSADGKMQLVKALRERNINVKDDQAFLVFIRLRSPGNSGYYVADVMGTHSFQGQLRPDDIRPILLRIARIAREVKRRGYSIDQFVRMVRRKVTWLGIRQEIQLLSPLLRLLEKAMKFIHP